MNNFLTYFFFFFYFLSFSFSFVSFQKRYGQTGSGKTFTISGVQERIETIANDTGGSPYDGLVPRSIRYLFECIDRARQGGGGGGGGGSGGSGGGGGSDDTTFSVRASFAEIYNEQVYDLLNLQSGPLQVRGVGIILFIILFYNHIFTS